MSPLIKYGGIFFQKLLMADGGEIFFGRSIGGLFYMGNGVGVMMISCQGQESFTNTFSSNLKTVNLKTFANHKRIQT